MPAAHSGLWNLETLRGFLDTHFLDRMQHKDDAENIRQFVQFGTPEEFAVQSDWGNLH